jgi:two-component system chemotaxis sensor kinase CheA
MVNRREEMKRQLMVTFQAELKEHVSTLNKSVLALEEDSQPEVRTELLAEALRAAHSLKGAARTVGLADIGTLAHRLEDFFGALQRAELIPGPDAFNLVFQTLDLICEAMAAELRGETLAEVQRDAALNALTGILQPQVDPAVPVSIFPPASAPLPEPSQPKPAAQGSAPALIRPTVVEETIRVGIGKVDALMASMEELATFRMRSETRLVETFAIQQQLASWEKVWRKARPQYNHLKRQHSQSAAHRDPDMERLLAFLSENENHLKALRSETRDLAEQYKAEHHRLSVLVDDLQTAVHRVRMLPVGTLFDPFPRMVRDLAQQGGKEISLQIEGAEIEMDRQILEVMKDPLIHLLRNAVDHGIESPLERKVLGKPAQGVIRLSALPKGSHILIQVCDDGAGLNLERIRRTAEERGLLSTQKAGALSEQETIALIFEPGMSTADRVSDISGRGIGMDVVRQNLEKLHGLIEIETAAGRGTVFSMTLPLTLASTHVLLVQSGRQTLAAPTSSVERILRISRSDLGSVDGRPALRAKGKLLPFVCLSEVLGLPAAPSPVHPDEKMPVVVLGSAERRVAFQVDGLVGTQEVVMKNLGPQLRRVRNIAGASILGSGQLVMILNVGDLMKTVWNHSAHSAVQTAEPQKPVLHRVLVVDDSITTRTLEKNILENAGYQVLVAADGQEALSVIESTPLDAVISDVNMPRLDGFSLTEKLRQSERYQNLPVVLVTSLETAQDKVRGLEAGANAYMVKNSFDHEELLATLQQLIG